MATDDTEPVEGYPPDAPDEDAAHVTSQPLPTTSLPIELEYDGPRLQGEMSALQLSTVLQGVDEYAHALVTSGLLGDDVRVRTVVRDFDEGSFDFTAIIEVLGFVREGALTAAVAGAGFGFWWRYMRRVVANYEHQADRGTVKVTFTNGETNELTEAEWQLLNNKRARRAIGKITSPLRHDATKMVARTPWDGEVTYSQQDGPAFEEPVAEPPPASRRTVLAYPETVNFDPTKQWRLWSQALGSFSARIEDSQFINGVDSGRVRVGKTDSFEVAIRIEPPRRNDTSDRYFIERVIEHTQGPEQHGLPMEDER